MPLDPHVLYDMYVQASTSFSRKDGEMKSGGAIFFSSHKLNGMEAIGARAYGAVSGVVAVVCTVGGAPKKLRVFGIQKAILYNVVHVSSDYNKRIE
jgi:hypothetical protein